MFPMFPVHHLFLFFQWAQRCGIRADNHSQKRNERLTQRKSDPAVLVDIPQTPGADELEKSGAPLQDVIAETSNGYKTELKV